MQYQSPTWTKVAGIAAAAWFALGCGAQSGDSGPSQGGAPPTVVAQVADPAAPDTQYGTKGDAHLFVGAEEVGYIFFTVLAPARDDLAHVYFLADPHGSVNVSDYYISLVLERALWRTGNYSGALGGRAAVKLSSGAEYESDAAQASLSATLTTAAVLGADTYLHGNLVMFLAAKSGGEPLRVEVRFD